MTKVGILGRLQKFTRSQNHIVWRSWLTKDKNAFWTTQKKYKNNSGMAYNKPRLICGILTIAGFLNLSLNKYPFCISTEEHVPLKLLTTKTLS